MMMIISGRVVPAFTRSALKAGGMDVQITNRAILGPLSIAVACSALLVDLFRPASVASASLALLAAPLLLIRQSGWQFRSTLDRPMLWILHIGHAWLAVGFAFLGASSLFGVGIAAAHLHAFTAGAMGTLILGMMSRVSLGHSGRPIEATTATVWMFILVIVGAAIRVVGASGPVELYQPSLLLGGALWTSAWIVFGVAYARILLKSSD
ncbi:MAG: NnrS family protein [Deltaproteobacteria bacterium]|nr:NnrS family protein [Deltaproteobacteria bacterium]